MASVRDWVRIVRLGLVQASIGAVVVFSTSTLNRVMVVELAMPAIVPGALVALHYAVQMLRPRWGHGSDRGGRRTPWIVGGMAVLSSGGVLAAIATALMASAPAAGVVLAVLAFVAIGIGVGAAGTSLLLLLASAAGERRRPAAATVVWMMMIVGFIVTAGVAGHMLAPFSIAQLVRTAVVVAGSAFAIAVLAIWGVERSSVAAVPGSAAASRSGLMPALREVWAEPAARRFTLFVFFSMLAYSAQELIIEPFAGTVFGLVPADSAKLAGLQHGGLLVGMVIVALLGSAVGGPRLGSMRLWTMGGCAASALAILGLAGLSLAGPVVPVDALRAGVFTLGVANGAFSIAAVAAMMQLAGLGRAGRDGVRMGLWGAAQAIAFAVGGVAGTGASDLARHWLGSPVLGYAVVFASEALLFSLSSVLAARAFPAPGVAGERSRGAAGEAGRGSDTERWAT